MKVLLLAKYDQAGASSRYRTLQYLDYLNKKGIKVTTQSLLDSEYIGNIFSKKKTSIFYYLKQYSKRLATVLFQKNNYDLCWIEGELFPYLPFFIEKFFLPKRFVVEYDDAIFHNYDMHRRSIVRRLLGKKISHIMQASQHVIVGNDYVKQYALQAGADKVTVLPTVVDAQVYQPSTEEKKQDDKIVIGWLGSPTTVKYLGAIEPVLQAIAKKAQIKLCVIGGEYKLENMDTICHHWPDKWSEAEEIALLNQIDIGIMPLVDSSWERGKCGFKLIKYMAFAKPVIASPVSSNCEIVVHGENGYLAESEKEWEEALLALITNATECRAFGQKGRERMVEKYSLQTTAPILYNVLQESASC